MDKPQQQSQSQEPVSSTPAESQAGETQQQVETLEKPVEVAEQETEQIPEPGEVKDPETSEPVEETLQNPEPEKSRRESTIPASTPQSGDYGAGVDQSNLSPEQHIESSEPNEPAPQAVRGEPEVQERVVEKIVEKQMPRELNEEEQQVLYRTKLKILSAKGNQSRSSRRLANHGKIIEYLKQHGYITNNEVEKICRVKNSAAWKYLKELEEQHLVIQLGERGKLVRYRLRQAI